MLKILPSFSFIDWDGGKAVPRTPEFKGALWSGERQPPEIGETIRITINNIGPGVVTGYQILHGFLAVRAYPLNPPEWWIRQNGRPGPGNDSCVFGCEWAPA